MVEEGISSDSIAEMDSVEAEFTYTTGSMLSDVGADSDMRGRWMRHCLAELLMETFLKCPGDQFLICHQMFLCTFLQNLPEGDAVGTYIQSSERSVRYGSG